MKKLISLFLCLFLLAALTVPVLATSEVTEPEDEVVVWDGEELEIETVYAIISTYPVEEIEGEGFYWLIPEDGTFEAPIGEDGVIQWGTIDNGTTAISVSPEYNIVGDVEAFQFPSSIAGDTLLQPETGSAPAMWLVLLVAISAVLVILALLVVIVILLIALIISLVTRKKKKQKPSQQEAEEQ